MRKEAKKVNIKFVQGKPMDLAEIPGAVEMGELTEDQKDLIGTVGPTIAAYIKAAQELLSGKLAYLKSLAPPHLADPGNVLIVGCSDGVVIRYETKSDKHSNVVWGSTEDSLPEITSALSEGLIRIRHDQTDPLDVEASGIDLKDWRRYLEDNLSTVQRELGLLGITPSPRCLIVIGRAGSLSPENRRKLAVIENESPRLKILTYDDVLENAKAVVENLLGPLWNVHGATHIYFPPTGAPMDTGLRGGIGLGSGF